MYLKLEKKNWQKLLQHACTYVSQVSTSATFSAKKVFNLAEEVPIAFWSFRR